MEQTATPEYGSRKFWPTGWVATVASGLTGLLAITVAIKAAAYAPSETPLFAYQDHFLRILAFAALMVWTTFTLGIRRRGAAAMITLAFACVVELVIVPARGETMGTLVSANLGIVFAYCGLQLYWLTLVQKRMQNKQTKTN